jgi:16S rRNA (cytosine1402-N4)-methyltransferase
LTGGGDRLAGAVGGPSRHVPVLLAEIRAALRAERRADPAAERDPILIDGTFGAGGYARALLNSHPAARVIAIDRDPEALAAGRALAAAAGGRLVLVEGRFGDLDAIARGHGVEAADGVVLDIGVSSMQLDTPERGFSFRHDGPLDMRMERDGVSAADLVNGADEAELADIFFHFGEERRARAVARGIIEARRRAPIGTTGELAALVARFIRPEPGGIHPATRVFQALRIAVNDELGELVRALYAAERILGAGGRLAAVTFHSLEDRIVKQFLLARSGRGPAGSRHLPAGEVSSPTFVPVGRGPVAPGEAECARNPRARSAKLRAAERTDAPPGNALPGVEALAALPSAADGGRGRR